MEVVRVVRVSAFPMQGASGFAEQGGAFINVYTTELSVQAAMALALTEVENAGWLVRAHEGTFLLTRADFDDETSEVIEYFEQALIDGVVLVIHTYPTSSEDGDTVH